MTLKKIFFSILFIGITNITFASFPIGEKYQENVIIFEESKLNDSSIYGNLSLILSLTALLPWLEIGIFGWPLLFLSIPALIFGIMSFNTKARLQGLMGSVIGFLHIIYWTLVLILFSSLFGW